MEANVILMKCRKTGQTFGVRVQKMEDGDWYRTWAFPISNKMAVKEGFDKTQINGSLYDLEGFPGCPYCGEKAFVQCGYCNKISCYSGEKSVRCQWCGKMMKRIKNSESFDVSGGAF